MKQVEIPAGFVDDALDCMRQRGLSVEPVLARAGLPEVASDRVHVEHYAAVWLGVAKALNDEFFGLGARPMPRGSFDLLCRHVLKDPNLEQALKNALQFLRVILGEPHGVLVHEGHRAIIRLREASPARSAFAYRTFWALLHGIMCWITGRRIPLLDVRFRCPAPVGQAYATFFGVPVRFSQAVGELVFDAKLLSLPTIRDESALVEFLHGAPANIIIRYRSDTGVSAAVRKRLQTLRFVEWPTFEELAKWLEIPPATLRRQLSREGQSYQSIKDELRLAGALTLLREGRSVGNVAAEVGFSEPSAFHRAFKRWTSRRPGESRPSIVK